MATLDGVEIATIRAKLATFMIKAAAQGSTPSASALMKLLDAIEGAEAAAEHRSKLEAIEALGDAGVPDLARYLGQLGEPLPAVEHRAGRPLSEAEAESWRRGARDRLLEARALELHRARAGHSVPEWALRAPLRSAENGKE